MRYPVVVSEWGWMEDSPDDETAYLVGSEASYGTPLLAYLDEHGTGWIACWYDDEWLPAMFNKGFAELNGYGNFVKAQLAK